MHCHGEGKSHYTANSAVSEGKITILTIYAGE